MSNFNFGSKETTFNESTSVSKWLDPWSVQKVHIFNAELKESSKKKTPYVEITLASYEPVEGLKNSATDNKQKTDIIFYLTDKTVDSGNASDIKRFLGILADRLGVRDAWEKAVSERVSSTETYVKAIKGFFAKKPFYGLIGAEEILISKEGEDPSIWNKPYLWIFGSFARPLTEEGLAELEKLITNRKEGGLTIRADRPDPTPSTDLSDNEEENSGEVDTEYSDDEW